MDIDMAGWILEFLLRQNSLDDRLLNLLIRVLPLPINNPSLKKSLILRKLESDIEKGTISERTLEFLEQIEELDHREGNIEVSEAMKAAYCAVAVHCTAKFIEESADDKKGEYFSAVRRIWRARVREMEKFDVAKRVGLVSDDLLNWMDDIEAGVWVVGVCENVLVKYKGLNAPEAVLGYVIEAKKKMGPSFLELVAETLSDDSLREIMGLGKIEEHDDRIKEAAPIVASNVDQDINTNANSKNNETSKANVLPRRKHIAMKRPRGAKIVDPESSPERDDIIPTPEVNKRQETLETNTLDLRTSISGGNMAHGHNRFHVDPPSASPNTNGEARQANRDQNKAPKISLMGRNSTVHTIELSDSIDSSNKGSPTRPHFPSPNKRAASPLKKYENKKLPKTRKKKRWTNIEEDTLRTGVLKYGKGNWKLILNMYRDIFEDRTEVDLKDKWRNLIR